MNIAKILIFAFFVFSQNALISKDGIGDITFDKKLSSYSKNDFYKTERKYLTDEAGDSTLYYTFFLDKKHFIVAEVSHNNKDVVSIGTNSASFYTADSIHVGSTFEQLVSKYDDLAFMDGAGGTIVVYMGKEQLLFELANLDFKDGFNYENKRKKFTKTLLLKNVINKNTMIEYIKVLKFPKP